MEFVYEEDIHRLRWQRETEIGTLVVETALRNGGLIVEAPVAAPPPRRRRSRARRLLDTVATLFRRQDAG